MEGAECFLALCRKSDRQRGQTAYIYIAASRRAVGGTLCCKLLPFSGSDGIGTCESRLIRVVLSNATRSELERRNPPRHPDPGIAAPRVRAAHLLYYVHLVNQVFHASFV